MSEPSSAGGPGSPAGVVHLLDRDCPPIAASVVRLLIERLGPGGAGSPIAKHCDWGPQAGLVRPGGWPQTVVALGDGPQADWLAREGVAFQRVPLRGRAEPLRSMVLGRWLARAGRAVGLIHAHSPRSAGCATAAAMLRPALRRTPIVVEVFRRPGRRRLKRLASCIDRFELSFLARSNDLRRVLAGAGIPADRVGLLRPPLEMSRINAADRERVRGGLGLSGEHGPVLLASGWCHRGDGQKLVLWAGAILGMLYPNLRVVVPGDGPQRLTIRQWFASAGFAHLMVSPGRRFDWPNLLAAADVLVHAAGDEADTTPIGWAMSAGVPVVAAAAPGTAELVRDHQTGLLCKAPRPRDLAMQVRQVLIDRPLADRLADQARREAFAFFKPADAMAAYAMLYTQLTAAPAGQTEPRP